MKKSDKEDEGIGIVTIVLLILIGAFGLYFLLSSSWVHMSKAKVSVETPAPPEESK